MDSSNITYLPEENTGLRLKGESIREIEYRLSNYSALHSTGYRSASRSDLPDNSIVPETTVYIQEYEMPHFEGDNHLNPEPDTGNIYSVAGLDAHYFVADEEVSHLLPEFNSDFYTEPR